MKKICFGSFLLFLSISSSAQIKVGELKLNENNGQELEWSVSKNDSTGHFVVQRSDDNKMFYDLTRMPNRHPVNYGKESPALVSMRTDRLIFYFKDTHPAKGNNYYRIVYSDSNYIEKTNIVHVYVANGEKIVIYPNPVTDSLIVRNAKIGDDYSITTLYDYSRSHPLKKGEINKNPFKIDMKNVTNGRYQLEIKEGNSTTPFYFDKK